MKEGIREVPQEETSGPSERESRRLELLESLESRMDSVRDLRKLIDSFDAESEPEEVESALQAKLKDIESKLPKEKIESAIELQGLQERRSELDDDLKEVMKNKEEMTKHINQFKALIGEIIETRSRISELSNDTEIVFVANTQKVVSNLIEKNQQVHELEGDKEKAVELANKALTEFLEKKLKQDELEDGPNIDSSKVSDVRFDAFDLGVVLESEHYSDEVDKKRFDNQRSDGRHISGSPVYLIKKNEDNKQMESIIQHEKTHNVIDGASAIELGSAVVKIQKLIEEAKKDSDPLSLSLDHLSPELNAKRMIDSQHNEILAALEEVENKDFRSAESSKRTKVGAFSTFNTAGGNLVEGLKILAQASKDEELSEKFRKKCATVGAGIADELSRMARIMRTNVEVAKKLGPEALDDVHALFAMLPPSQYRDIRMVMEHKYGKEKVQELRAEHEEDDKIGTEFDEF